MLRPWGKRICGAVNSFCLEIFRAKVCYCGIHRGGIIYDCFQLYFYKYIFLVFDLKYFVINRANIFEQNMQAE